jgi:hypothetical protein
MRAPPVAVKLMKGLLLHGHFDAANKTLAHHRTHGAAHEVKLKTRSHHRNAVQRPTHHDQSIRFTGVLQRLFKAIGVFFAVLETQRVNGKHFLADLKTTFGIEKSIQARARANAVMVATFGANVDVLLQIGFVQNRFARRAFHPQTLGHRAALTRVGLLHFGGKQFFKPTHGLHPFHVLERTALKRQAHYECPL